MASSLADMPSCLASTGPMCLRWPCTPHPAACTCTERRHCTGWWSALHAWRAADATAGVVLLRGAAKVLSAAVA